MKEDVVLEKGNEIIEVNILVSHPKVGLKHIVFQPLRILKRQRRVLSKLRDSKNPLSVWDRQQSGPRSGRAVLSAYYDGLGHRTLKNVTANRGGTQVVSLRQSRSEFNLRDIRGGLVSEGGRKCRHKRLLLRQSNKTQHVDGAVIVGNTDRWHNYVLRLWRLGIMKESS